MPDLSPQILLDELAKWKHNRSVYPGWLIAPEAVRQRLWLKTENWLMPFMQIRQDFSLQQQLAVVYELNWRLETALLPIWDYLIPAYEHVVEAINPFPIDLIDLPSATLILNETTAIQTDWTIVRHQWLSAAFGLLRYFREERQFNEFESMHARLGRIGDQIGDWRARWCYERCLFEFGEMNDESVVEALGQWPTHTHDIFWTVRKAAVLAELGQTDAALDLCTNSLVMLRESLSDHSDHIPNLSREGWASSLAVVLRNNKGYNGRASDVLADREEVRRRFAQLKKFGCSPDEIESYFRSRLDQPPPQPEPQAVTRHGFEPGTVSHTVRLGGGISDKLIPAYQYFRLTEEAAQPPACGTFSVSERSLRHVADWFSEHDPARTQAIMLRLRDDKLVENYINRHRVAALQPDAVLRLRTIVRRAISQSLPAVPSTLRPEGDEDRRVSSTLRCAIDLFSRACMRDAEEQRSDAWDLACTLYKHPSIRSGLLFGTPLRNLFSHLVSLTPEHELAERLWDLFHLPVAGESEFAVSRVEGWPDPPLLSAQKLETAVWNRPPANWAEVKRRLFEVTQSSNAHVRRTAFLRLLALGDLGALTASERRHLARIFWAPVADLPGLPVEAWQDGTLWFALNLPEPNRRIVAEERVREYILLQQPGRIHGGIVRPDRYCDMILMATDIPHQWDRPHPDRWYVSWTRSDIRHMVDVVRAWWDTHGCGMAEDIQRVSWRRAHDGPAVRTFMNRLWDVMRLVIIPRIGRTGRVVTAVLELIAQIQSAGMPVGAVLPATMMLRPNSVRGIVSRLRQEFASPEVEYYLSALRGIMYWIECSRNDGRRRAALPDVPPDLLREVSMAVALRRPESLGLSLDFAFNVIRRFKENTDRQFVQNLFIGLDYLFSESAYRQTANLGDRYSYEEIPHIRWLAARLARQLADCGYEREPIIQRWLQAMGVDPLPEVREIRSGSGII